MGRLCSVEKATSRVRLPSSSRMLLSMREAIELQHVVPHHDVFAHGLLAQDGDTGFDVRLLYVGDEAPLKAAAKALLQPGDVLGGLVGGEDDLLARGCAGR